jgi:hypothetical protein
MAKTMRTGIGAVVGAAILAFGLGSVPGQAQVDQPRTAAADEAAGVDQVVLAARIADWGRRNDDAPALIVAARILAQTPMRDTRALVGDGAEGGTPSTRDVEPALLSVPGLLDEAEDLSRGDARTLEDIAAARAAAMRGVVDSPFGRGPIVTTKEVQARQTYWFQVNARVGELLRVAVIGDGDTDIDLSIRDAQGRAICQDGQSDHFPVCTVRPAGEGPLRIDIVNRGSVWTKVQIVSN